MGHDIGGALARQSNQSDLLSLAQALSAFDVGYVVIGGAAMALHGFARMTKDPCCFSLWRLNSRK